jgi:D-sedoheptulose 7-phosphate isomerase
MPENLKTIAPDLKTAGDTLLQCLLDGGKLMLCGNGGSASDAQHFAAEIVGRFERERRGLPGHGAVYGYVHSYRRGKRLRLP